MIKRSLLATSISLAALTLSQHASAIPLLPMDARGLAMGNTGVASAKLAHAPQYNPALLSTANEEDDFALLFPQVGAAAADEDEILDTFDEIANDDYKNNPEPIIDHFETILDSLDGILTNGSNSVDQQISGLSNLLANGSLDPSDPNFVDTTILKNATSTLDNSIGQVQVQTTDLTETTFDLTNSLDSISGSPLRGTVGVNAAIAIPSKTFAMAISLNGSAHFSGRMFFTKDDQSLLNDYAGAINDYAGEVKEYTTATDTLATTLESADTACNASPGSSACNALISQANTELTAANQQLADVNGFTRSSGNTTIIGTDQGGNLVIAEDPDLTSTVQIVAVGIAEVGLTFSRSFNIAGEDISIGITPKLQTIKTYNYVANVEDDDIEEDDVKDTEQNFSDYNLDAGIAYQFGGNKQWQVGLVAKNLMSKEYKTESNAYGPSANQTTSETKISLDTQFRGGISHTTDWTVVAIDLDLAENDPVAFEAPTQYASIGGELDLFDTLQLRAGYRTNLSESDASVASVGLGFSPFGAHLDIAAMANPNDPKKEAGAALELGFYF